MKRIYSSKEKNFGASPSEIKTYIQQLRQGDETVWLVIYGQNQERFLNYVRTLDNSNLISDTAVENLVETAYEKKFLGKLRGKDLEHQEDLRKYFFTILYNLTMDFFDKLKKEPISYGDDDWLKRIKHENDAEIKAEKEVLYKCIDKALPALTNREQVLIDLRYYHEPPMKLKQIAEKLGETEVSIKKIHERVKIKLRAIISPKMLQTK